MINELINYVVNIGVGIDEFLINEDFAKSLIAEGIGIVVEVILITVLIANAIISKKKKNFKVFIEPLTDSFIKSHNNNKEIITNLSDEFYVYVKYIVWSKSIIDSIDEFNNQNTYEHYPELSRELLRYSLVLKQTKKCATEKRFDEDIYDEIFRQAEKISQSFINNKLSKEGITFDIEFISSFKKELSNYNFS